jgi:hypothetical protein
MDRARACDLRPCSHLPSKSGVRFMRSLRAGHQARAFKTTGEKLDL